MTRPQEKKAGLERVALTAGRGKQHLVQQAVGKVGCPTHTSRDVLGKLSTCPSAVPCGWGVVGCNRFISLSLRLTTCSASATLQDRAIYTLHTVLQ